MSGDNSQDLIRAIPEYLSKATQAAIAGALRDFRSLPGKAFYFRSHDPDPLQGDVWRGLRIRDLDDGKERRIRGILVSNSCDMDPSNQRFLNPTVTFAPVVRLSRYRDNLLSRGIAGEKVENHVADIQAQRATNRVFLPLGGDLEEDHVALLDYLHHEPLATVVADGQHSRIATLSQVGFYLLLFKLSVHFCRFLEATSVDRGAGGIGELGVMVEAPASPQ